MNASSKILIADLKRGAERLSEILSARHELHFADTRELVVELADKVQFDLVIVGILVGHPRMYDLMLEAKDIPSLAKVPVVGFSDEHTKGSNSSRNTVESIMHMLGAADYIDSRDMTDEQVCYRIEKYIPENKKVSRETGTHKTETDELSPTARRIEQDTERWDSKITQFANQSPDKRDSDLSRFMLNTLQFALKSLDSKKPLKFVLNTFCTTIESFIKTDLNDDISISVLIVDQDRMKLRGGAAPSLPEEYTRALDLTGVPIGPNAGSCGTAAFLGQPVYVTDIDNDSKWKDFVHLAQAHGLKACWSIPIFDEQPQPIATFAIYHRRPRAPQDKELELVGASAAVLQAILFRARTLGLI